MKLPLIPSSATLVLLLSLSVPASAQIFGRSVQSDLEQGAKVAKQVEQQIGLCALPEAGAWVGAVGARLVTVVNDPRWRFSFHIVDQAEPNAFAIPGGGVYVSRGLLALVNREDELGGVLGHEIAHVTERHSARQQRRGILPSLLTVPGNIVGNVVGQNLGSLINAPIELIGGIGQSRYSRGQESASDRIGTGTAAAAGYEPMALAEFLARLEQDVASQTGEKHHASLFDSHPMTEDRMRDIQYRASRLKKANRPPVVSDTGALFAKLDGLWWGENPEAGVFRENQFLHPGVGFAVSFPPGWEHRTTPKYAISSHPQSEAILALGVVGPETEPHLVGAAFVEKMRTEARTAPTSVNTTPVNGLPVYVATYLDQSGREPNYLHFAWAKMAGTTYQIIAVGLARHEATLRAAALSLRPMEAPERQAVTGKRLRIATARAGERLDQLGRRTGNAWSPAYTALANGLEEGAVLQEGQPIKIARTEAAWIP
jgi:predicted Zn-dependent protease